MAFSKIGVIDSNRSRQDALGKTLLRRGFRTENFDDVSELPSAARCGGIYIVADEDEAVSRLFLHLSSTPRPFAVIAASDEPEIGNVVRAMRAGAISYLIWPATRKELFEAVDEAERELDIKASRDSRVLRARYLLGRLTKRELEVIRMVGMGLTSREMSAKLGISHRTIDIHRSNALMKLDAKSSAEAIALLYESGCIDDSHTSSGQTVYFVEDRNFIRGVSV